jgi:predicted nuclease of restriction endonuclease-like (RecB) superfamily
MVRFAEAFSDAEIVSALRSHLSWPHFKQLIYIDDPLKCDLMRRCVESTDWSTRMLAQKIERMRYERTALSKTPPKGTERTRPRISPRREAASAKHEV